MKQWIHITYMCLVYEMCQAFNICQLFYWHISIQRGRTALHYAAESGHIINDKIIKTLLNKGCNPNIKDKVITLEYLYAIFNHITQDGNTALHLALQPHMDPLHYSDDTIVKLLLKSGADPDIRNKVGTVDRKS